MSIPVISIIIPIYNVEKYLRNCVDSILAQMFTDFELLLIDDGSTDGSGTICDEYAEKDSRVRVFHKENGGVSTARNMGLDNAVGKIVCFVDGDDWVTADYCTAICREMEDDVDLLYFQAIHHYPDGSARACVPICGTFCGDEIESELEHLMVNMTNYEYFGYTWNKAFRRSLLCEHGIRFIEGLSCREDEEFTLRVTMFIGKLRVIPNTLYGYRILQSGLTGKLKKASEYNALFHAEESVITQFKQKRFRDCLRMRNASYLFSAFKAERGICASSRRFNETFLYYKKCGSKDVKDYRAMRFILGKPYCVALSLAWAYKLIMGKNN